MSRGCNSRTPRKSSSSGTQSSSAGLSQEERGYQEVTHLLDKIAHEVEGGLNSSSETEDGPGDSNQRRVARKLDQTIVMQERLHELGKVVGDKGKPTQIVQDAHLSHKANAQQTIPTIRSIKITPSVWNSKEFTRLLRLQLARKCIDPEQYEEEQSLPPVDDKFVTTFMDEFAQDVAPGLAPDLSTVFGSFKDPPVPKVKPAPKLSQKVNGRGFEEKQKPQVAKKLQGADMDGNVDPTMQRCEDLFNDIVQTFLNGDRKPLCLVSLLLDRSSFHKTVENYFCFSFLLKDSKVRLYLDDAKLPVCLPVQFPKQGANCTMDVENGDEVEVEMEVVPDPVANRVEEDRYETVMTNLTEDDWRRLVETFFPASGSSK